VPLEIREALPSDAPFLARAALHASRAHVGWGLYDVVLGLPDAGILETLERLATSRSPFFHHYSRRLVAEVDGQPAGSIAAFPNDEPFRRTFVPALADAVGEDALSSVAKRRAPWMTCAIDPPEGAWVVELVATMPAFRGRGIGRALLDAVLDRGRANGHREAAITFEIGNIAAGRLYEAARFAPVSERRHPDFERAFRVPGLVQVRRDL
jgi:translation initiation factor 4G